MSEQSHTAHVEGASGTFVVPMQSPYDRQILREQVLAGRVSALTLGRHGTRWIVTRRTTLDARCASCSHALDRLRCSSGDDRTATCIDCAIRPSSHEPMEEQDS